MKDHGVVFCDIDGTLSDDRPRAKLLMEAHEAYDASDIKLTAHYDQYHLFMSSDELFSKVAAHLFKCHPMRIVFITARTEKWRKETADWLADRCRYLWGRSSCLYMRANKDIRSNEMVKADHIAMYLGESSLKSADVKVIIDDSSLVLNYLGATYPMASLLLAAKGELSEFSRSGYYLGLHTGEGDDSTEISTEGAGYARKELPSEASVPETVDGALTRLAGLYLERNALYKDNYKKFGMLMVALQNFVPGGSFPTETEDDWNRLCMLFMMASKLSRYCASYMDGGHLDSLDDTSVYAQMLNEIDHEIQSEKRE